MTLLMWRAVIRPSFAPIADTLREEFANKRLQLYESIYVDFHNFKGFRNVQKGIETQVVTFQYFDPSHFFGDQKSSTSCRVVQNALQGI